MSEHNINISEKFERYVQFDPLVPVYCVTPGDRPTIHRFYDTSPISPSGRYIALTELPYEDHIPVPGDEARVLVIDLEMGEEVYSTTTMAWDTQVGAHVQWGGNDTELFFNRMSADDWCPYGVKVNIFYKSEMRLGGTIYMVSPDGQYSLSPSLNKIGLVQPGYGVLVPNLQTLKNKGASDKDGVYITNNCTGYSKLVISFKAIFESLKNRIGDIDLNSGAFYGFHVKWNVQGTRIMFIMRWLEDFSLRKVSKNYLVTFRPDGSDITIAIDATTWKGGHHPNWCADGKHILMNLAFANKQLKFLRLKSLIERIIRKIGFRYFTDAFQLRFATFFYDGSGLTILGPSHYGSGHPTLHVNDTHILTDAYPGERVSFNDGTVPLRMVNIRTDKSECVVRVKTVPRFNGPRGEFRVDPHPAWCKSNKLVVFNACPDGPRKVYVADFSGYRFP